MKTAHPIENVQDALWTYLWVEHRRRTQFLIGSALVVELGIAIALFMFVGVDQLFSSPDNIQGLFFILLLPFAIYFIPYAIALHHVQKQFYRQIAASYGFTYEDTAPMSSVTGQIFTFGHSQRITHLFSGTYEERQTRFFTFHYTTGSGKSQQQHQMLVWEVECGVPMLHLLVRPRRWGISADWSPRGTVSLRPAGPFSDQFEVYTTHEMEIEALMVLEPAFMALYMDSYAAYGFECIGTKIYVFSFHSLPQSRTAFKEDLNLLDALYDHLVPKLQNVSDEVVALREAYKKK